MKSVPKALQTFIISILLLAIGEVCVKSKDACTMFLIAIMLLAVLLEALFIRRKLLNITKAIRIATNNIKKDKNSDWYVTHCTFVDSCFIKYKVCMDSLHDNKDLVALSDYINSDLISIALHKSITDQIANAMTGLGILGTFIGLSIGLQGFHTDSTQAVTDSIPILLNGIKTAFYTSISGVLISIIFTHFYHQDWEDNSKALEELYGAFSEKISPSPEVYYYSKMLEHQAKQTDSLNSLAASIGHELAPRLAKEIKSSIVPTMEHLNQLITTSINNTIDDYIKEAVQTQSDTLQKIVDSFMQKLNAALKNQFDNLGESIEHMCEYQHSYTDEIQSIIDSLNTILDHLGSLNSDMTNTIDVSKEINQTSNELFYRLKRYVDDIRNYQNTLSELTQTEQNSMNELVAKWDHMVEFCTEVQTYMDGHEEKFKTITQITQSYVDQVEKLQNSFAHQIKQSNGYIEATEKSIKLLVNKIENFAKLSSEELKTIGNNAVNDIKNSLVSEQEKVQSKIAQIIKEISNIATSIEDGYSNLSVSNDELKKELSSQLDKLSTDIQQKIEYGSQKNIDSVNDMTNSIKEGYSNLSVSNDELKKELSSQLDKLSTDIQQKIEKDRQKNSNIVTDSNNIHR